MDKDFYRMKLKNWMVKVSENNSDFNEMFIELKE